MEGVIVNFRQGRHHQYTNQMIVQVNGMTKEKAKSLIGKNVVYTTEGKEKKQLRGRIKDLHGNSGALRAYFETGMPGQSIGKKVRIEV